MILRILKILQLTLILLIGAVNLYVFVDLVNRLIPWDRVFFNKYFDFNGFIWTILGFIIIISTIPAFVFQKSTYKSKQSDEPTGSLNHHINLRKQEKNGAFVYWSNTLFGICVILIASLIVNAGLNSFGSTPEINVQNVIIGIVAFVLGLSVILKNGPNNF